ncbi:RNA-binding protein [uncultured Cohaesibacter sp.]|uniref:RNA-binding protein n=1 Tax=uncultured Cohaesibacter sp. TaxID=1002546 RepID=UPI0029C7FE7C|nr:RNA-binding protein [uncultured Cohaesibacter sp.]
MPQKSEQTTRQCLVTRESLPKDQMIRFVLAPDLSVVPDLKMRLPGRGVWVTARQDLVKQAADKGLFARGFKQKVQKCDGLDQLVTDLMEKGCLSALSMTRKAGQIITGFAKVETSIAQRGAIGLIHAADAAEDGQKKLAQAVRRHYGSDCELPVVRRFSAEALSTALGYGNVVHAALLAGSASGSFIKQVAMLDAYSQPIEPDSSSGPDDRSAGQASTWGQ